MRYVMLLVLVALGACGASQEEYDKLLIENRTLEFELDELKNGEARLIALIEQSYEEKAYKDTKSAFDKLKKYHPESNEIDKYSALLVKVEAEEAILKRKIALEEKAKREKREAEAKDKERLANLNNTGMWQVTSYVDDFGEPTKDKLIRNLKLIRGVFSNSATEGSELDVRFLIDSKTEVDIILYEYAGNNPVKAYSPDEYRVLVQDKGGNRHTLKAFNYRDRLSFGPKHSTIVFSTLLKGGKIKFRIIEVDTPTTQYEFEISNSKYFDNAVRLMKE